MHNPYIVLAIAAYFTVFHLGMLLAAVQVPTQDIDPDIYRRRALAGTIAYLVGIVAAVGFGFAAREKAGRATYTAIILICLFALPLAVYPVMTLALRLDPCGSKKGSCIMKTSGKYSSTAALLTALGVWVLAKYSMEKL